jgi:hypothetical protein
MTDENSRPNSISLTSDLENTHGSEKSLFPEKTVTIEPVRVEVADKMSRMLLLRQLEDDLQLYDHYNPSEEAHFFSKSNEIAGSSSTVAIYLPLLASAGYVFMTGSHPLHLSSYSNNIKMVSLVAVSTWVLWKSFFSAANHLKYGNLEHDRAIIDAKAQLHTNAVRLTNELKFPKSDLH